MYGFVIQELYIKSDIQQYVTVTVDKRLGFSCTSLAYTNNKASLYNLTDFNCHFYNSVMQ